MRRYLIAGNWKMNAGPTDARRLAKNLKIELANRKPKVEVLVCPPTISLVPVKEELEGANGIEMGAQNVHFEDNGAFTGEVSTEMLKDTGCRYAIIGHSERRSYFCETDEIVNKKALKCLNDGVKPIICVGETLDQRKAEQHKDVVKTQVTKALENIDADHIKNVVIAYEPVWAIGTGETATPEQAQEMHKFIRSIVADLYDEEIAGSLRILYGGSMKPHNANELLQQEDVDGGLIGGASLKAQSFSSIIETAESLS
ncbi:MAG TPA: triose-phosphate isomerase [Balneolales bacterium]|nr:triose-phosphate isomerase [Balneolales bacterium]